MDAGAAAVLAATVAGVSSALGVTLSALITGRTAVSQAANAARIERDKLDADASKRLQEARQAGYFAFRDAAIDAVQKLIDLAGEGAAGPGTVTPQETRHAVTQARISLLKHVVPLGDTNAADAAERLCKELEASLEAAAAIAAADGDAGGAALAWKRNYALIEAALASYATSLGVLVFGVGTN
ncbi:hypothetical protein [Streptomyces sp. NPDC003036]|uniref:hypothetical protein n=1 Tax=Streptomyces sp. NPDC003036 TaxID=3154442 RepID=UPI0033B00B9F